MVVYEFETKIEKDGTIRILEILRLAERDVELFIVMIHPVAQKQNLKSRY